MGSREGPQLGTSVSSERALCQLHTPPAQTRGTTDPPPAWGALPTGACGSRRVSLRHQHGRSRWRLWVTCGSRKKRVWTGVSGNTPSGAPHTPSRSAVHTAPPAAVTVVTGRPRGARRHRAVGPTAVT